MTERPLEITTPTHGMAIASYALAGILGGVSMFGLPPESMVAVLGRYGSMGWALSLAVCSVLAIAASLSASHRMSRLRTSLTAEFVGVAGTGFSLAVYLVGTLTFHALTDAMSAKLMSAALVIGAAVRATQILRELRRLRAAEREPPPAIPGE